MIWQNISKFIVGLGIVLMLAFLAAAGRMMNPVKTCTVSWVDEDNRLIEGLFSSCPATLHTRSFGGLNYTQFGNSIYRVHRVVQRIPGELLRPRVSELLLFQKYIDGPVDFETLAALPGNDSFLSDGTNQFVHGRRLSLTPPLDFEKIKPVPPKTSMHYTSFHTDGTWVLHRDQPIPGADAATFHELLVLRKDGLAISSGGLEELAADNHAAYYGGQKIKGADPATINVIAYCSSEDAPPGVTVQEPDGSIVFDRRHAWRVTLAGIERIDVSETQLKALRADLQQARSAAAIGW